MDNESRDVIPAPRKRRIVGEIERSVKRELRALPAASTGMNSTLRAMALLLARAIDSYSDQLGTSAVRAAHLSAITKAHTELRATMRTLLETGNENGDERTALPAPVWDAAESGTADAGRAVGGGGQAPR